MITRSVIGRVDICYFAIINDSVPCMIYSAVCVTCAVGCFISCFIHQVCECFCVSGADSFFSQKWSNDAVVWIVLTVLNIFFIRIIFGAKRPAKPYLFAACIHYLILTNISIMAAITITSPVTRTPSHRCRISSISL